MIVLATILIVVILASIIFGLVLSQSRLTHHQVSRIQAYYANQAAINFALENLRTSVWTTADCPPPAGCVAALAYNPATHPATQFVLDLANDFSPPNVISNVTITIIPAQSINPPPAACYRNPLDTIACITSTATYTYTP
ncbi:MAG: hypothetical protein NTZ92_05760 [Candidatus Omnitrophica bacterium]|nr:hypothetical protein [Candidatus Omnitrophota bacterium]